MKILHVYKLYGSSAGGGIKAIESIVRGTGRNVSHEILACARHRDAGRAICPTTGARVMRVRSLGYINSMPLAPTLPLRLHLEARRSDLIHLHAPFPLSDIAVTMRRPRQPIILHWHADIVAQNIWKRVLAPFIRSCMRKSDRIVVGSPALLEHSRELARFRDKSLVIPYGVFPEDWTLDRDTGRRSAPIAERYRRMVFFVGRLVEYKGLRILLQAMQQVDGVLVIGGEGPQRSALEELARELGVASRIVFTGALSHRDLKAHLHACNVFALPSRMPNESFGICQLEAMVCAKPIVNTALPTGVPWVARDGHEALTVPPDDPAALAHAINAFLDNPELAARTGRLGRQRVLEAFDAHVSGERMLTMYRELAATGARSPDTESSGHRTRPVKAAM